MYMHTHTHIYIYIFIVFCVGRSKVQSTYVHVLICEYVCMHVCVIMCTCICGCVYVCKCTCVCVCVCVYMCGACACVGARVCVCTCMAITRRSLRLQQEGKHMDAHTGTDRHMHAHKQTNICIMYTLMHAYTKAQVLKYPDPGASIFFDVSMMYPHC